MKLRPGTYKDRKGRPWVVCSSDNRTPNLKAYDTHLPFLGKCISTKEKDAHILVSWMSWDHDGTYYPNGQTCEYDLVQRIGSDVITFRRTNEA